MKNLQTYFFESSKLYEFKIKLANYACTPECVERIKNAIDAYCVETMSKPKRLPIQEHRDFGKLGPCECEVIDVAVRYPTIAEQIRQLVINRGGVPASNVCVYTKDQYLQEEGVESLIVSQGADGPIIANPELADVPGSQALVGQGRVASLIKELEEHSRLNDAFEVAGTDTTIGGEKQSSYGKTTNDLPQNETAPLTAQRSRPDPMKAKG